MAARPNSIPAREGRRGPPAEDIVSHSNRSFSGEMQRRIRFSGFTEPDGSPNRLGREHLGRRKEKIRERNPRRRRTVFSVRLRPCHRKILSTLSRVSWCLSKKISCLLDTLVPGHSESDNPRENVCFFFFGHGYVSGSIIAFRQALNSALV